jgi:membrane-associated phospholipid phosphatase
VATRRYLLGGALAAAILFIVLARWVLSGEAMPFDLGIRAAVHAWASPLLTRVMIAVTTLGSEFFLPALGAVVVWLATAHRGRPAILLATGSLTAELALQLLKLALHRPRPPVFFGLSPAETYSFPSGHVFVSTVFYGLLAGILMSLESSPRKRVWIAAIALLLVLLIGFSRVYLGYHYPSDVLGGWVCAAVWLTLARLAQMKFK